MPPEEINPTHTDNPVSGGTGGAAPVAPSPAPVSPTPSSPSSLNLAIDPETGKSWQQLYYEMKSQVGRLGQQLADAKAQLGAQVQELTNMVGERDRAITQLNSNVANLTETAAQVPGLQEQVSNLSKEAALGRKYRAAMKYPDLLHLQVEQPVEGQETPATVNPVLTLIESSDLPDDALDAVLQQMSAALPQALAPPAPARAPTAPSPAEPVSTESVEYWEKEIERIHQEMISNPTDPTLFDRFLEAERKKNEAAAAPK